MKYLLLKLAVILLGVRFSRSVELDSGYRILEDGRIFRVFNGDEVNAVWNIGDYEFDKIKGFIRVPNQWNLEDLRQNEVIYRPI
jgi:hypothetical protein